VKLIRSLCGDTKTSSSPHLSSLSVRRRLRRRAGIFHWRRHQQNLFSFCCRRLIIPDLIQPLCRAPTTREKEILYKIESLKALCGLKLNSGLEKQEETARHPFM
jgi:hypothetical protein